jgi:hypothetical protein
MSFFPESTTDLPASTPAEVITMHCMEMERNAAEEITTSRHISEKESVRSAHSQARSRSRSRYNGVALLATMTGLSTIAGFAWLYYYAVSALQSALAAFKP